MRKWICLGIGLFCLCSCTRYQPPDMVLTEHSVVQGSAEDIMTEGNITDRARAETITNEKSDTQGEQGTVVKDNPIKVRGIYVSAFVAGTDSMMEEILNQIDQSEINTVVIDVKDDEGYITFLMNSPLISQIGSCKQYISDIDTLISRLKEHNLYVIARVVAFRDPFLAEQRPEWGLQLSDQSLYRDRKGMAWINPYKNEVWEYLVEVGKEAEKAGFDEVQFDYIRFSTEKGMADVVYQFTDTQGRTKSEVITECVAYIYEQLNNDIYVSADVFGTIIGNEADADSLGQIYTEIAKSVDYISPMIYPSHYGDGSFGLVHPDLQPYDTVLAALRLSQDHLPAIKGHRVTVRPWLQSFTASYLKDYRKYGASEVQEQIQAVYDAGYEEWILWNAASNYTWDGLQKPLVQN